MTTILSIQNTPADLAAKTAATRPRHAERTRRRPAGIRVGSLVEFDFEGRRLVGRVNRISRRATLLAEDASGLIYSDGKRYQKFYVPVGWVRKAADPVSG